MIESLIYSMLRSIMPEGAILFLLLNCLANLTEARSAGTKQWVQLWEVEKTRSAEKETASSKAFHTRKESPAMESVNCHWTYWEMPELRSTRSLSPWADHCLWTKTSFFLNDQEQKNGPFLFKERLECDLKKKQSKTVEFSSRGKGRESHSLLGCLLRQQSC